MLENIFQSFAKKGLTKLIVLCNNIYKSPSLLETQIKEIDMLNVLGYEREEREETQAVLVKSLTTIA